MAKLYNWGGMCIDHLDRNRNRIEKTVDISETIILTNRYPFDMIKVSMRVSRRKVQVEQITALRRVLIKNGNKLIISIPAIIQKLFKLEPGQSGIFQSVTTGKNKTVIITFSKKAGVTGRPKKR